MAKETWMQDQCQEVEACLRKNNSKKAYQLVRDLTTEKQGKSTTICHISHPSKVMLKIILNRLQPQAEEIIAEEQAGFKAGRSTTEQIFNLRNPCEKYLQHQQNLYHVFIDVKKAFDRVWHEALLATMRKYNINASIKIYMTRPRVQFCSMAAQENSYCSSDFRQGCLLSPTLFNIFLERIICDALDDHER